MTLEFHIHVALPSTISHGIAYSPHVTEKLVTVLKLSKSLENLVEGKQIFEN